MKKIIFLLSVPVLFAALAQAQVPTATLVQIVKAEDARAFDKTLEGLMTSPNAKVRERAALAAGRIGREEAIPALVDLLSNDTSNDVRAMAAFAIGEVESIKGADAILKMVSIAFPTDRKQGEAVIARAVEAAGKIVAANAKDPKAAELGKAIIGVLEAESSRGQSQNREVILLAITAALRARPEKADVAVAKFLTNADARIRSDAANTMTRLRAKNANEALRNMLATDPDAVARANAARALGAAEDKDAFDLLLKAATTDADSRVRVSAIRSVAALKDARAADKLIERGEILLQEIRIPDGVIVPWYGQKPRQNQPQRNELIEIATALARLLPNTDNGNATDFLNRLGKTDRFTTAEILTSLVNISPKALFDISRNDTACYGIGVMPGCERFNRNHSLALAEFAKLPLENEFHKKALGSLEQSLTRMATSVSPAVDDQTSTIGLIEAYSAFKDAKPDFVKPYLQLKYGYAWDPFIRAAAAGVIADLPSTKGSIEVLRLAFADALIRDKHENDAQLAILDALNKIGRKEAVGTLLTALNAPDYLVRKKAFELLADKDLEKDFPGVPTSLENAREKQKDQVLPYSPIYGTKLGQVLNAEADYRRAVSRKNGSVKAVFATEKGTFTIDFFPEEAPLTVDNFVKLARTGYFNGLEVHRVVPNFVMQDGDPRGDGNGGPGWSIRCEVNMREYDRGAVGMALSGKDSGGSQWFVTHSPQPHLDGGYTVFGHVNETDMKVVDNIVRGDKIITVKIIEGRMPPPRKAGSRRQ